MIILGLTGSVGMGKTEAGKYFLKNNIDVFDCDKEIANLYSKKEIIKEIKNKFPSTVLENKVDKTALTKLVFSDRKKLKSLEEVLHKKLRKEQSFWLRKKIRQKKKILVFDVPLLLEKDNLNKYDIILILSCSKDIQRRRVLNRENWNEERFENTLKAQIPDSKKKALADIIVKTDRGKRYLYQRVFDIIKKAKFKKNRRTNDILGEF